MKSRAETEYRYEKLTWPEINDAVDLGKVCILRLHGSTAHVDADQASIGLKGHGADQDTS